MSTKSIFYININEIEQILIDYNSYYIQNFLQDKLGISE